MTFFYLLSQCNYDWERAKEILYSLDDRKIVFINSMLSKQSPRTFGDTSFPGSQTIKSFDLRNYLSSKRGKS